MTFDYAARLRDGMLAARWTIADLWIASVALSGRLGQHDIGEITSGARTPTPFEYNVLAAALNEHFVDHGHNHPLRYWDDP